MSNRVITFLAFNLRFTITPDFGPPCAVSFTDIAPDGHSSKGEVTLVDAPALRVWQAVDKLAAVNAELDLLAQALPDLPTIASRMTVVSDLEQQMRAKQAALAAANDEIAAKRAAVAAADEQIATQHATLAAASAQIAAKQAALDAAAAQLATKQAAIAAIEAPPTETPAAVEKAP